VIPLFQFDVIGRRSEDKLDGILKVMKEKSFSQFPVFDDNGKVIEIINTNTITRWLGKNIVNNEIITENPKICQLFDDIEFSKNYLFIKRDLDIYSAYNLFVKHIEQHSRNLDVLFITATGRENEKLLGLITIEDIAGQF
jgi:CBS domain-containing protein